ncbi:hypothetical protein M1567_00675 [Candidatus Marsarchaeota archaeon]|jgi:hypothetical protein|nr:hypothetical protein [Candidatus Marsarchaeota archaeon]
MPNEINFMDLTVLKRIKPDTTVEKFGGLINSSFFDASNALGTLKLKGLVDFTTYVPGQNAISITEMGKKLLEEADSKEKMPFDQLDLAILTQLSTGKRNLADLSTAVNISSKDLAMHLYKLSEQQYLSADIRNGAMDMSLTEKGFMQAKAGMPQQAQAQPQQQVQSAGQAPKQPTPVPNVQAQQAPPAANTAATAPSAATVPPQGQTAPQEQMTHPAEDKEIAEMQKQLSSQQVKKSGKTIYYVVAAVIIIIILAALFAKGVL